MDDMADNPWANAAAEREETTKRALRLNPTEMESGERRETEAEDVDPDSCGFLTLYQGMQLWHLLDLLLGFLLILYGSLIARAPDVATVGVVLILGVGILLFIRAFSGALHLCTESVCHRCGLVISARTSPILACTWFVLMFINLVVPGHVRSYLSQHHMLWHFLQKWESNHKGTLTLLLLGAFLLECVRWQLVQSLHRKLQHLEAVEDRRATTRADRRTRFADRPWWFGRSSENADDGEDMLTESLLPIGAEGGERNPSPRTWTFLGRPRRTQREYESVREDASVDFASVQEEWASRTEEDPYWWSRDEESDESTSAPTTTGEEVSWATENKE